METLEKLSGLIQKSQDYLTFCESWKQDLQTKQEKEFDFDRQEKIYTIENKIEATANTLVAQKSDYSYKVVNSQLPLVVEQIDKSKLQTADKAKFDGLKKRVKQDKYQMFQHKAQDYQLANDLLQNTLQS